MYFNHLVTRSYAQYFERIGLDDCYIQFPWSKNIDVFAGNKLSNSTSNHPTLKSRRTTIDNSDFLDISQLRNDDVTNNADNGQKELTEPITVQRANRLEIRNTFNPFLSIPKMPFSLRNKRLNSTF